MLAAMEKTRLDELEAEKIRKEKARQLLCMCGWIGRVCTNSLSLSLSLSL
jgi:hypothetical protein